jgi:hypothetical protein
MKTLALLFTMCAAGFAQQPPGVKLPPETKAAAPTVQAPQSSTPANAPDANAMQARQILQRTIQALGGKAYLTFFDMRQQGRGFGFNNNEPQGVGLPYTRLYQYPDKELYEYFRQGDWRILHIGDKGFETTWRGTKPEDPKTLADYNRRRQVALDYILRGWFADPATALFYDGKTISETKQVHKVTLMNAKNQSVTLFIDEKTFLPVKRSYTFRDPETKDPIEEEELYDQYRDVQGIMTPYTITRKKNGDITAQRFLRSVEYNVGIGDAKFAAPKLDYDRNKK